MVKALGLDPSKLDAERLEGMRSYQVFLSNRAEWRAARDPLDYAESASSAFFDRCEDLNSPKS